MTGNGKMVSGMALENNSGLMGLHMRDTGKKISLKEMVNLFMPMAIFMMENGKMIKLMAKELIFI